MGLARVGHQGGAVEGRGDVVDGGGVPGPRDLRFGLKRVCRLGGGGRRGFWRMNEQDWFDDVSGASSKGKASATTHLLGRLEDGTAGDPVDGHAVPAVQVRAAQERRGEWKMY